MIGTGLGRGCRSAWGGSGGFGGGDAPGLAAVAVRSGGGLVDRGVAGDRVAGAVVTVAPSRQARERGEPSRMPFSTSSVTVSSTPVSPVRDVVSPLGARDVGPVLAGLPRALLVSPREREGGAASAGRRGGGEAARFAVADQPR